MGEGSCFTSLQPVFDPQNPHRSEGEDHLHEAALCLPLTHCRMCTLHVNADTYRLIINKISIYSGAGEMVQGLGACIALAVDPDSIPSTSEVFPTTYNSSSKESNALF